MNYPLKDLDAQFTVYQNQENVGLMFRCPNCRMYGSVTFKPVPAGLEPRPSWTRVGDTIDTLTLTPSVMMNGHFHSWIRKGELQVDSPFSCKPLPPEMIV